MIETQIVKENNKPVAVIMDYKEYVRLREIEQERKEYDSTPKTKAAKAVEKPCRVYRGGLSF